MSRTTSSFASFAVVSALAAACASASPAPLPPNSANVTGTVGGAPFAARSAIARYGTVATSSVNGVATRVRGLTVALSDKPNDCAVLHGQSSTNVTIAIPGNDVGVGKYPVTTGAATVGGSEID